ncbi:uncharacterized protein SCHCODRAFT_02686181 [Schizophyllum commune H4-8]|nr:uncharacterized protein SCHCODRAFT_02686181 [Schizophyllum commune H4-8]KAI5894594.1 hypothetical protein SCHCODRAFT_02686181 [Schizophyllum commune H4-8]
MIDDRVGEERPPPQPPSGGLPPERPPRYWRSPLRSPCDPLTSDENDVESLSGRLTSSSIMDDSLLIGDLLAVDARARQDGKPHRTNGLLASRKSPRQPQVITPFTKNSSSTKGTPRRRRTPLVDEEHLPRPPRTSSYRRRESRRPPSIVAGHRGPPAPPNPLAPSTHQMVISSSAHPTCILLLIGLSDTYRRMPDWTDSHGQESEVLRWVVRSSAEHSPTHLPLPSITAWA